MACWKAAPRTGTPRPMAAMACLTGLSASLTNGGWLRRSAFDVGRVAGRRPGGVRGVLIEASGKLSDPLLEGLQPLLVLLDKGQDRHLAGGIWSQSSTEIGGTDGIPTSYGRWRPGQGQAVNGSSKITTSEPPCVRRNGTIPACLHSRRPPAACRRAGSGQAVPARARCGLSPRPALRRRLIGHTDPIARRGGLFDPALPKDRRGASGPTLFLVKSCRHRWPPLSQLAAGTRQEP